MEGIDVTSLSGVYSGEPSLGEQLAAMAVPTRDEARGAPQQEEKKKEPTKLEISLVANFVMLGEKYNDIHDSITKRNKAIEDSIEADGDIFSELNKTVSLFETRSLVEKKIFSILLERFTAPFDVQISEDVEPVETPKVSIEDPWEDNDEEEPDVVSQPDVEPDKKAEGGITPADDSIRMIPDRVIEEKMADTMQTSMIAAGSGGLAIVDNFLQSLGPLGIVLKPQLKSFSNYAVALGLSRDSALSSLGGSILGSYSKMSMLQKEFGKTWAAILGDDDFINQFIDREWDGDPNDPDRPPGYVPADWKDDPEFSAALNELCKKWGINANHLLGLMAIETASKNINPAADNGHHVGLIQFSYGFVQNTAKMSVEDFKKLSRAQQIPYVDKYFEIFGLPKNPTAAQLYTLVFLPAFVPYATDRNVVLASKDGYNSTPLASKFSKQEIFSWWNGNPALHGSVENDITVGDLEDKIKASTQNLGLSFEKGGSKGGGFKRSSNVAPYVVEGPKSGFDFTVHDASGMPYDVELHGKELVAPSMHGFKVFPIENNKFSISKNPEKTISRWDKIVGGSNLKKVDVFKPQESYIPEPIEQESTTPNYFTQQRNTFVESTYTPSQKKEEMMAVIRDKIIEVHTPEQYELLEPSEINEEARTAKPSNRIVIGVMQPAQSSPTLIQSASFSSTIIPVEVFDYLKYREELCIIR